MLDSWVVYDVEEKLLAESDSPALMMPLLMIPNSSGFSARNPARELTGVRELGRLAVLEIVTVTDGFYA